MPTRTLVPCRSRRRSPTRHAEEIPRLLTVAPTRHQYLRQVSRRRARVVESSPPTAGSPLAKRRGRTAIIPPVIPLRDSNGRPRVAGRQWSWLGSWFGERGTPPPQPARCEAESRSRGGHFTEHQRAAGESIVSRVGRLTKLDGSFMLKA
jgi:hypothetical protein